MAIELFESNGFRIHKEVKLSRNTKVKIIDEDGYLFLSSYKYMSDKRIPMKFHISNPYTIENIIIWCNMNRKSFVLIDSEYKSSRHKMKWFCNNCKDYFFSSWSQISVGKGCGVCHGKQVGKSNSLGDNNIKLSKEWHPRKNGRLTPFDFTAGSGALIWWICSECSNEWTATINSRKKNGCPFCSGRFPTAEYNLFTIHHEVCDDWDYSKNNKQPSEYTPFSGEVVNWICHVCHKQWKSPIRDRVDSRGCSICNVPKGEKKIIQWLNSNNINFNSQKRFDELLGCSNGKLSYDFYLPEHNLLIEYQGEYHDGTANNQTQENLLRQIEHDKRKKEYAKNNSIELLEIWHYDFKNIESILEQHIKLNP